jgi:succinyl-diaminopimelate desuccinylase
MKNKIVELMSMLVGTDTANPPGKEKALADQLTGLLEGCDCRRLSHGNDRESLVVTLPGANQELVLGFAGHLDTVPVGDTRRWKHNPLGEIIGDVMYGRGTADMCGGLAAMLLLIEEYEKHLPPVTLKFLFTADEEADGTGAKALLENGLLNDLDALIICEPSNLKLGICEKGTIWLKITVHGKSSHASMPGEGINALQLGMKFMEEMKERIERLSAPHPLLGGNTCEITGCKSGIKINILPGEAQFLADIRTLPAIEGGNSAVLNIIEEIRQSFENEYNISISVEEAGNREPIEQPEDSQFIRRIRKAIGKRACDVRGIYFYTDGSLIIPKLKIPFVIYGPGLPENCHKTDESISLWQIEACYDHYRRMIDSYQKEGG